MWNFSLLTSLFSAISLLGERSRDLLGLNHGELDLDKFLEAFCSTKDGEMSLLPLSYDSQKSGNRWASLIKSHVAGSLGTQSKGWSLGNNLSWIAITMCLTTFLDDNLSQRFRSLLQTAATASGLVDTEQILRTLHAWLVCYMILLSSATVEQTTRGRRKVVASLALKSIFAVKLLQALIDRFSSTNHELDRTIINQLLNLQGNEDEITVPYNVANCTGSLTFSRPEHPSDFTTIASRLELLLVTRRVFAGNGKHVTRVTQVWRQLHGLYTDLANLGTLVDGEFIQCNLLHSLNFGGHHDGTFDLPHLRGDHAVELNLSGEVGNGAATGDECVEPAGDIEQPSDKDDDEEDRSTDSTGPIAKVMLGEAPRQHNRGKGKQFSDVLRVQPATNDGGGRVKRTGGGMSDQEGEQSRKKPKSRTVSVNTLELYSFLVSQQPSVSPGAVFKTLLHFGLEVGDEEEAMAHLAEEAKKFKINSSTKLNKLLKKLNPTLCLEEQAEEDDGVVQSEDEVSNESTSGEGDAAQARAAAVGPNRFPAQFEFGPGAEYLQNGDDESEDEESNESIADLMDDLDDPESYFDVNSNNIFDDLSK